MEDIFQSERISKMHLGEVYFWTDSIKDWKHLLKQNKYKQLIIDQLKWLQARNKISIYAFVIMPNHLHLVWEMLEKNGKEMPYASFNKWTSSQSFLATRPNGDFDGFEVKSRTEN